MYTRFILEMFQELYTARELTTCGGRIENKSFLRESFYILIL